MSSPTYPITGITAGGIQPRQEALRVFESMDTNDQLSCFRVAGLHGLPATSWDSDPLLLDVIKNYLPQYANSETGDHRAYMLLFEQRLWEIMTNQIVAPITDPYTKAQWLQEANAWRMPY
ncbi:tyrosinase [Colletotrichum higginsianum]|nr:tyrosinase [Colletotrichum higginsianum]